MARLPCVLMAALSSVLVPAQASTEVIDFNGFPEGAVIRDQYVFLGLRLPADPGGGPFIDDAGALAFLLDSPPNLLSLSPFAAIGGSGQIHASVGTYVFDFVDPTNPFVPSFTDHVEVAVALADKGSTVLTAYDASGSVLATQTLELSDFSFITLFVSVSAPGIQRATLTTPLAQPTLGALVDTVVFTAPAVLPARPIEIDIRPGSPRNLIRLNDRTTVPVAILSSPGFEPGGLDLSKILFQRARPVTALLADRNHDRVVDLVLNFPIADLQGLTEASTEARLTAVDLDGTPLAGADSVIVKQGPTRGPVLVNPPDGLN